MLAVLPGPLGWLRANAASFHVVRLVSWHSSSQGAASSRPIRCCHLSDAYYVRGTIASTSYSLILHSQLNLTTNPLVNSMILIQHMRN